MNYSRIKEFCTKRKISIEDLANRIGMSKGGLYNAIANETLKIDSLEKICKELNIPIGSFFDEEYIDGNKKIDFLLGENNELKKECEVLRKSVIEKEELVDIYRENIDLDEFFNLSKNIVKNAINGKGLIYLEYNEEEWKFIEVYKELAEKVSEEEIGKIVLENKFGIKKKK